MMNGVEDPVILESYCAAAAAAAAAEDHKQHQTGIKSMQQGSNPKPKAQSPIFSSSLSTSFFFQHLISSLHESRSLALEFFPFNLSEGFFVQKFLVIQFCGCFVIVEEFCAPGIERKKMYVPARASSVSQHFWSENFSWVLCAAATCKFVPLIPLIPLRNNQGFCNSEFHLLHCLILVTG
jgi:hypothetical protein